MKKMDSKTVNTLILVGFFILVLFNGCLFSSNLQLEKDKEQLLNSLEGYKIENKAFREFRTKDSATIVTQTQTILSQTEAIKLGLLKLEDRMKKVESSVGFQYDVYVDSVTVPFVPKNFGDTTGFVRIENGKKVQDSIAVPKAFAYKDKWFSISGDLRKFGLVIDSVVIPNKSTVTVGWEKKNFFSKQKPVVQIKNENPHIRMNEVNNVVIKDKKGLFQKKGFWIGVGVLTGFFIQKQL